VYFFITRPFNGSVILRKLGAFLGHERQILEGGAKGDVNKIIAYDFYMSERTFEVHCS
jgi:FixJ family two-component response regulator